MGVAPPTDVRPPLLIDHCLGWSLNRRTTVQQQKKEKKWELTKDYLYNKAVKLGHLGKECSEHNYDAIRKFL